VFTEEAGDAGAAELAPRQERELSKRLSQPQRRSLRNLADGAKALASVNPFQTNEYMSAEEWGRFALGMLVLAPFRVILITLVTIVCTALLMLSVIGQDLTKPLPDYVVATQRVVAVNMNRIICKCFGIYNVKIVGRRALPSEAKMMVVAPHSTMLDAVVIASVGGGPGVAKGELERTPLLGAAMRAVQTLFVHRDDKNSRQKVAAMIKERISRKSSWNKQMSLFPEGTCTNRTSLIAFRRGAFEPGEPVQPVCLTWEYDSFDPAWTGGSPNRLRIALRSLAQWRQDVTVTFLPVYEPSEEERRTPELFTQNVRELMASHLGVPCTDFSYTDMFLAKACAKARMQPAFALPFTFASLEAETADLGVTKEQLSDISKKLLRRFGKAPGMKPEARLSQTQFEAIAARSAKVAGVPEPLAWEAVADQAVADQARDDGTVSFHSFLLAHVKALAASHEA